jgi:hypothetical protein
MIPRDHQIFGYGEYIRCKGLLFFLVYFNQVVFLFKKIRNGFDAGLLNQLAVFTNSVKGTIEVQYILSLFHVG